MEINIEKETDLDWFNQISKQEIHDLVYNVIKTLSFINLSANISIAIILADNDFIHYLNQKFANKDKATNVLTFPNLLFEEGNLRIDDQNEEFDLGDILFSYDKIMEESINQNKQFRHHFIHLIIHGILHIFGFDHQTKEQANRMEDIEINMLKDLGINDPF